MDMTIGIRLAPAHQCHIPRNIKINVDIFPNKKLKASARHQPAVKMPPISCLLDRLINLSERFWPNQDIKRFVCISFFLEYVTSRIYFPIASKSGYYGAKKIHQWYKIISNVDKKGYIIL
jgi:hypothetical protein